jgi:hypothetical protein
MSLCLVQLIVYVTLSEGSTRLINHDITHQFFDVMQHQHNCLSFILFQSTECDIADAAMLTWLLDVVSFLKSDEWRQVFPQNSIWHHNPKHFLPFSTEQTCTKDPSQRCTMHLSPFSTKYTVFVCFPSDVQRSFNDNMVRMKMSEKQSRYELKENFCNQHQYFWCRFQNTQWANSNSSRNIAKMLGVFWHLKSRCQRPNLILQIRFWVSFRKVKRNCQVESSTLFLSMNYVGNFQGLKYGHHIDG